MPTLSARRQFRLNVAADSFALLSRRFSCVSSSKESMQNHHTLLLVLRLAPLPRRPVRFRPVLYTQISDTVSLNAKQLQ